MCFKICKEDSEKGCPCKDYNEYEVKLRCVKTKLHSRYIAFIAVGIVIWMLATGEANSPEFSSWISFASTVVSIILSVIAIIMSITGESKTDAMRNQMERTANKLEETADSVESASKENAENIKELKGNIEVLQKTIENMPGKIKEEMSQYEKTKYLEKGVVENSINDNVVWVKKNDQ